MRTSWRLALFAAAMVAVFSIAFGVGRLAAPTEVGGDRDVHPERTHDFTHDRDEGSHDGHAD